MSKNFGSLRIIKVLHKSVSYTQLPLPHAQATPPASHAPPDRFLTWPTNTSVSVSVRARRAHVRVPVPARVLMCIMNLRAVPDEKRFSTHLSTFFI